MFALLCAAALAGDLTVDADAHLSMRPGVSGTALVTVWKQVAVGGALDLAHDPYLGDNGGLTFDRQHNLRVGLLPAVSVSTRPGPRDRVQGFTTLQLGPELLWTEVRATTAQGVDLSDAHTVVSGVATWESGLRVHTGRGLGLVASLRLPLSPGLAAGSIPPVERVGLGVGVTWRRRAE